MKIPINMSYIIHRKILDQGTIKDLPKLEVTQADTSSSVHQTDLSRYNQYELFLGLVGKVATLSVKGQLILTPDYQTISSPDPSLEFFNKFQENNKEISPNMVIPYWSKGILRIHGFDNMFLQHLNFPPCSKYTMEEHSVHSPIGQTHLLYEKQENNLISIIHIGRN